MSTTIPSVQQQSLHQLRVDYVAGTFDLADLVTDPFEQFKFWFDAAKKANVREPNAMTLATVDADLQPSARIVLLKDVDPLGFTFFGNYASRKARAIEAHPRVALLFFWETMERQIRVEGVAEKVSREESAAYFSIRPRAAQIGAWASHQSAVISSRDVLETSVRNIEARFPDVVPLPDFWGGWRVLPTAFEFWQGGAGRLHDRFRYTKHESAWSINRLSP